MDVNSCGVELEHVLKEKHDEASMWNPEDYLTVYEQTADRSDPAGLAPLFYQQACRETLSAPGFALIQFPRQTQSQSLRRWMVALKQALAAIHLEHAHKRLLYVSMGRFDQQATTKPHRDNGPDESLLMLGYESTPVESRLSMFDYALLALKWGVSPAEFLVRHNPMQPESAEVLTHYRTDLTPFDHRQPQVLLINNSQLPPGSPCPNWHGVLHHAEIVNPSSKTRRVVNSTLIESVEEDDDRAETVAEPAQAEFTTTDLVH